MGNIFRGSEIVELGIRIEENGFGFYKALAKQSKNTNAAGVFRYLSGEEQKHTLVFQKILDKLDRYEPQGLDASQYYAYMQELAGDYIFTQKDKGEMVALAIKSDKEALNMAIGFEKDSIIFYLGMKKSVPEYDQKIVDELIGQEQEHLRQLTSLKKSM